MTNMQNIQYLEGYEHGSTSLLGDYSNATVTVGAARSGNYGLNLSCTSGRAWTNKVHSAVLPTARLYIRFNTLPNTDSYIVYEGQISGYQRQIGLQYNSSTGAIRTFGLDRFNNAFYGSDGFVPTTGAWYRFDLSITNTTVDWQVDGVTQPRGDFPSMDASSGHIGVWLMGNNYGATTTMDIDIDDVLVVEDVAGRTPTYPIGSGVIAGIQLDGDGTHNTASAFTDSNSNTPPASPSYTLLDDSPVTGMGTDYVYQNSVDANAYMEYTFSNLPAWTSDSYTTIQGFSIKVSYSQVETVWFTIVPVGGKVLVGSQTISDVQNQVVDNTLKWQSLGTNSSNTVPTVTEINAIKVRIGYSSSVTYSGSPAHVRRDIIYGQVALGPDELDIGTVSHEVDAVIDSTAREATNLGALAQFERINWIS